MATSTKKKKGSLLSVLNAVQKVSAEQTRADAAIKPEETTASGAGESPGVGVSSFFNFAAAAEGDTNVERLRETGKLRMISVDLIDYDTTQPRRTINPETISELRATIRAQGLLQAITVRVHPEIPGRYMVAYGERRLRACKEEGLKEIECVIRNLSGPALRASQIIENHDTARESVSPWEEARAIGELLEFCGNNQAEVGRLLGIPRETVNKRLALNDLPKSVHDLRERGILSDIEIALSLGRLYKRDQAAAEQIIAKAIQQGTVSRTLVQAALRTGRVHPASRTLSSRLPVELARRAQPVFDRMTDESEGKLRVDLMRPSVRQDGDGQKEQRIQVILSCTPDAVDQLLNRLTGDSAPEPKG